MILPFNISFHVNGFEYFSNGMNVDINTVLFVCVLIFVTLVPRPENLSMVGHNTLFL